MSKPRLEIYMSLIEQHAKVAYKKLKKPTIYSVEDLINEGVFVFLRILKTYDKDKADIRTYLTSSLRNHFFQLIRRSYFVSKSFESGEDRENYAYYLRQLKSEDIEEAQANAYISFSNLNDRERQYIVEMLITVAPTKKSQRERVRTILGLSLGQEWKLRKRIRQKIDLKY